MCNKIFRDPKTNLKLISPTTMKLWIQDIRTSIENMQMNEQAQQLKLKEQKVESEIYEFDNPQEEKEKDDEKETYELDDGI